MFKTLSIWSLLLFCQNIFAQITATPQAICNGANVVMTIPPQPGGSFYRWQQSITNAGPFANVPVGGTGTSYVTNAPQFYQVIVTTAGVPTTIGPIEIITEVSPVSSFTFSPNSACSGNPVVFTNTVATTVTYLWNFGDPASGVNNTSTLPNPTHTYTSFGCGSVNFTTTLTVKSALGCTNSTTNVVTVKQQPALSLFDQDVFGPFRNCENNPSPTNPNYTITLNNTSASASCITNYNVDWGDGATNVYTAANFPITHTYTQLGAYILALSATGTNGCSYTKNYTIANQTNPAGGLSTLGTTTNLCAPSTIPFIINNWENNSPGTKYVLSFGDGTSVNLLHPLNLTGTAHTVNHQYITSSCPQPTFTATLLVINACDTTPYTAGNIQVRIAPAAAFTVVPPICVNQPVCFTNTTVQGTVGAGCINTTAYTWNFGDPGSGANNTSNATNPCHTYTTVGNYTVTLTSSNPCGPTVFTKQICISTPITPNFTINTNEGCSPLSVTTTNSTDESLSCANVTYNWTVTYVAGFCSNTQQWNFTNGTTASSTQPSFNFFNSGTYLVKLTATNTCGAVSITKTIIVKKPPTVTLNPLGSFCSSALINPVAVVTNCGNTTPTYVWTFTGGTPSTSTTLNPGNITYSTPGTYSVSLTVTNECGTTTANTPLIIKEVPIATLPPNISVCTGAIVGPLSFTSSMAGSSFSWTNSNINIGLGSSGTTNPIPSFTSLNNSASQISSTINVTVTNNLCLSSNNFTITVNPKPLLPVVTTPINYCVGETALPLSVTASAGNTLLWYATPTLGTGSATTPIISTATASNTTYYVSQINTSSNCEGPRAAIVVNVNLLPAITISSTNPTACLVSDGKIIISGLNNGISYFVSYVKNNGTPTTQIINSGATGTITISGLSPGNYTNIFVTLNSCPSNIGGPIIISDPITPASPTIAPILPICSGNTLALNASLITGATYAWSGPNGFTNTAQNPIILNATVAASGNYSVTITVNGCTSSPATTNVTVNPSPNVPTASSNSAICNGANLNLFAVPSTNASYAWTGPNAFISTIQNPTIAPASIADAGDYKVIATLGTCKDSSTTTVIIKPLPVITATNTNPTACSSATGTITISGLVAGNLYSISYIKNSGTATTLSITATATSYIINNLTQGTYTNIFVTLNGCPSNIISSLTLVDPTQPLAPLVTNNGAICSGTTLNLTASTIPGATYAWAGPNGYTSNSQNPTLNITPIIASGIYSVIATVNSCASAVATTIVVINPTPIVPIVSSNSPICTGSNILLTASSSAGATFSWTGPNTFASTIQNPTITAATTANSGVYNVVATLGLCTSNANTTVIVKPTPTLTTAATLNPANCGAANGFINLVGLTPLTPYMVSFIKDGGAAVVLNLTTFANGFLLIDNLAAGTYTNIFVTLNNCPSNSIGPFTLVNPNPPNIPTINTNSPICAGVTLTLNANTTSLGAATFNWSGPNGLVFVGQSTTIPNSIAANAGTYFVTATINNCTSAQASALVVINPLPAAPTAISPISYCVNTTALPLTATAATFGNPLYWYNTNTGGTFNTVAPTPNTNTVGNSNFYVSQLTAQGCEGARANIQVVINDNAKAIFNPITFTGCPPFNITTSLIGLQQFPLLNNSYNWYANNVLIGTGINFPGYTILNQNDSVSIKLVATSLFGCKADSVTKQFFTYKVPVPTFTKSLTQGCGPISVNFVNTTSFINDFTYNWDFGNGQTSTLQQPGAIVFAPAASYNDTFYIIKLKSITICNVITFIDSVLVKSKPKALFTPNNVNGCSPMKVKFTNTSLGNGNTYFWNFDDGQTFTTTSRDTFTHIFYTGVIDTFKVKLIVTNSCGQDSISYNIITAPNNIALNFAINGTSQYGCAPHAVAFFNNSIGAGSFQWNFGDGVTTITSNNVDTVYHTYNLPGIYPVSVTAFNNCTDTTAIRTISVFAKPVPSFTANKYRVCIGEQVQFTDASTGATSRLWKFGDNTFSSAINPSHAYLVPGFYTVKLIVFNANPSGNVCSDSTSRIIEVVASLPGNISSSTNGAGCSPHTITFNNLDLPASSVIWDFGDGQTGVGNTISHTYTTAGTYTVHIVAVATTGCTFISNKIITIAGPAGTLIYTGGYVCFPNSVFFQASASATNTYLWNFGDGISQTTTASSVYHQYAIPGTYLPSVTLQNTGGCNILLNGLTPIKVDKIIGGFTNVQSQSCGFTTVNFNDTSTAYFGKALVKWNYGDGQTGIGSNVFHNYTASGNYNTEMIVIGNSGCTDTTRKVITILVKTKPTATIVGPVSKCVLETINFNGNINSIDSVTIKKWKLSNGATGLGNNFIYNFTNAGTYTLQLIAGTINGCFDTTYHTIVINPVPTIFASGDITLCRGNSANLLVTGNAVSYQWNPLQGLSCTNCTNPIASPLQTTPYIVSGTNAFGCSAYDTVVVTVIQPMNLQVSADENICIGKSAQLLVSGGATYIWSPAISLNNATISNPIATPTSTTIYRVVGYDGQNCFTDTGFVKIGVGQYPTVNLGPDLLLSSGTQLPLTTQIQNGPIQNWLWNPTTNLSCSTCPLPIATIKNDITYAVKVTTAFGCSASDSVNIKVFCTDAQVFIPNGFSPDGDGLNDILMVRGKGILSVKSFVIFNRWGEIVFEKNNFSPNNIAFGWDGKVKGRPATPDVFVYTAEVICDNGTAFKYKGNISLLK